MNTPTSDAGVTSPVSPPATITVSSEIINLIFGQMTDLGEAREASDVRIQQLQQEIDDVRQDVAARLHI